MTQGVYERTPEMREAIRRARLGTKASAATRAKITARVRRQALSTEWRKRVSRATRKAMRRKDVRANHLAGIKASITHRKKNYFGRLPAPYERELAKTLCPLGYVQQFYIKLKSGRYFYLDFALPQEKIAIECDGPLHRSFQKQKEDRERSRILKARGWKIIRVCHD